MSKFPKISVVTPSFNQANYIKETIDSVLNQRYSNLEYWVIDGNSSDGTVEILRSYGKKINWISEPDKGQTDAINKGMRKISGEIVTYLNSDDVMEKGALHTVAAEFIKNPEKLWLTGDYTIIDGHGRKIQSFVQMYKTFFRQFNNQVLLYVLNYINQPSTYWKRKVFVKIGYFDESLRYCMDYDFWLRLLRIQPPLIVKKRLSRFRIHSLSKGGSQYISQFNEESKVVKKYSTNLLLTTLHRVHSTATVLAYRIIK